MTGVLLTIFLLIAGVLWWLLASRIPWGPGIHIQTTRRVLEQIRRRRKQGPEHLLVLENPEAFLYGNIAADIINFKKYGGMKNHCHNWNIHERLWKRAHNDMERAFVLGYLCHLAADVIAHNQFIPYHRVRGLPPLYLGHVYWEALADANVTDEEWEIVANLRASKALHANDRLVWSAVRWKALSSKSNKWIFNNILLLSLRRSWRDLVRRAHRRRSLHPLDGEFFRHCRDQCAKNMMMVFDGEQLFFLKDHDPTGRAALRRSRRIRRELILKYGNTDKARAASRRRARQEYWVI